jgi:hypothetical protein
MAKSRNNKNSVIRLPPVLAIGFTGHRKLPDEPASRKLISDFLRQLKANTAGIVYGVSSVAVGGDLIFAECCLQLEIPLRALLPMPQEYFRKDFDAVEWRRVEHILKLAVSVEVTGDHELRTEGYYECGIKTAQQSQLMIALWDGEHSHGLGGTQEIVVFAKEMGKPVIWFHSETGAMQIFNEPALERLEKQHDPELDFLNGLPDISETQLTGSSKELAAAWLQKLDEHASRFAPRVRRLSSIPIVYTAVAAFLSGAGLQMPHAATWLAIGTALGITATAIPFALMLGPRQVLWARTRTAAEVCRSFLALWGTPMLDEAIGPEIIPELAGMLMSLKLLEALDGSQKSRSVNEFKQRYRKERVSDQIEYFSRHAVKSASEARTFRIVSWICTGLAILIAGSLFLLRSEFTSASFPLRRNWLSIAVSALFQLATISGALLIVNDCERRQRRYREVQDWLEEWDKELEAMRTWPTVLKVAGRIERTLLVELLEWKSLVQNVKLPRK